MPALEKLQEQLKETKNTIVQKEEELKTLKTKAEEIKTQIYAAGENELREAANTNAVSVEEAKNTVLTSDGSKINRAVNVEITNGTPE